jgi:CBS domain-containing protein
MTMLRACDIMQRNAVTVTPDLPVTELEHLLSRGGISGVPVVADAELVGVVSRTDVARAFAQATGGAEATLAYYQEIAGAALDAGVVARMAGERAAAMQVRDIMTTELIAVPGDRPVREIARDLLARRMHRVLVTEGRRLLGLVTTMDLIRAIADGRLVAV